MVAIELVSRQEIPHKKTVTASTAQPGSGESGSST
jgi:hypothetical protein